MDFEFSFEDALEKIETYGIEYAKNRSLREQLERHGETLYSCLFLKAEGKTVSEREHMAKTSAEYITHNSGLDVAQEREHFFKVKYEKAIAKFESLKCLSSQETARLRLGAPQQ